MHESIFYTDPERNYLVYEVGVYTAGNSIPTQKLSDLKLSPPPYGNRNVGA
jgi:hypothetical protein